MEKDLQRLLLAAKKLSLVLDLDQTVLHATKDEFINDLLEGRPELSGQIHPITVAGERYFIKLRPHLQEFLTRMSHLFEMHVYTMGTRDYAQAVVKLFDPQKHLFYDRILTRDDARATIAGVHADGLSGEQHRKNLKRLFPTDDSTVLIVDDRADVWEYSRNLVPVPPCTQRRDPVGADIFVDTFFVGVGDINRTSVPSPPRFLLSETEEARPESAEPDGETKSELSLPSLKEEEQPSSPLGIQNHVKEIIKDDVDEELPLIADILDKVHETFFSRLANSGPGFAMPDVKEILEARKRTVLSGVNLAFSGIIPTGMPPERFELWRLATMFGASCSPTVRPGHTTHLITFRTDTDKVLQAIEAGNISIMRPDWLLRCFREWKRAPEKEHHLANLPLPSPFHGSGPGTLDPDDLLAMNRELAELDDGNDSDDSTGDADEDGPPRSQSTDQMEGTNGDIYTHNNNYDSYDESEPQPKRRQLDSSDLPDDAELESDDDSFVKKLEQDLL